jgi:hypothetical protein
MAFVRIVWMGRGKSVDARSPSSGAGFGDSPKNFGFQGANRAPIME